MIWWDWLNIALIVAVVCNIIDIPIIYLMELKNNYKLVPVVVVLLIPAIVFLSGLLLWIIFYIGFHLLLL